MRQADRVTDRQNDSMTVWQNSRAAKEPALVSWEVGTSSMNSNHYAIFVPFWGHLNEEPRFDDKME